MSRSNEIAEAVAGELDDVSALLVDMGDPKSSLIALQRLSGESSARELTSLTIGGEKSTGSRSLMTAFECDGRSGYSEQNVSIPTEQEIPKGLAEKMSDGKLVEFPRGVSGYYDKENNKYHFYCGKFENQVVTNFQLSKDKTKIVRIENYDGVLEPELSVIRKSIGEYERLKNK